MATLREYFDTDFAAVLNAATTLTLSVPGAVAVAPTYEAPARVHQDFDSGTKYVSYFVSSGPDSYSVGQALVMNPQWVMDSVAKNVAVQSGYPGQKILDAADLKFSGRIFLYTEDVWSPEAVEQLEQLAQQAGLSLVIRSSMCALERSKFEKPLAFISHDSRDKADIAKPIALGLSRMRCPVWYDEYSLKVGDSLRARVENGLKECKKCVLVLSPHFLSNSGWTKTEFDSIFTRQILEQSNVVLPVWCGVGPRDVYEYSPSLADRVGVKWEEGIDEVLKKLYRAIEPPVSHYSHI